jgi:hypothetical protein
MMRAKEIADSGLTRKAEVRGQKERSIDKNFSCG